MRKAFLTANPFWPDDPKKETDICSWVQDRLRIRNDDYETRPIEEQIEKNRQFLGFLADLLVQKGILDPKDLIYWLDWSNNNIEVIDKED